MFVVEEIAAVVAEGTNAYQVVLEYQYDVSASYWYGGKLEVTGSCGCIAYARRGANFDGGYHHVDVSAGSRGGEVYTTGTTVCYGSDRGIEDSVACIRFVGVGTTL